MAPKPTRIKNHIRHLRYLNNEMSQQALAEAVGLTRQTINAIENGKYSPSLEAAFMIAETLGVSLEDVFEWEG